MPQMPHTRPTAMLAAAIAGNSSSCSWFRICDQTGVIARSDFPDLSGIAQPSEKAVSTFGIEWRFAAGQLVKQGDGLFCL